MKRLIAVAAVFGSICLGSGAAHATSISFTDSWTAGTPTHVTGTAPTLTTSNTLTSNDGWIDPVSQTNYMQTLTLNTPMDNWLLVAKPNGSGTNKMDIPVTFILSDGLGGTGQVTAYMNYYADYGSDTDTMAWTASAAANPGLTPSTTPTLSLPFTLTSGTTTTSQGTIQLPWETDWNMAQKVTYTVTCIGSTCTGGGGGGGGKVPEPASLALLGTALVGLGVMRRRRNRG